jgi:hypothetical protein
LRRGRAVSGIFRSCRRSGDDWMLIALAVVACSAGNPLDGVVFLTIRPLVGTAKAPSIFDDGLSTDIRKIHPSHQFANLISVLVRPIEYPQNENRQDLAMDF